MARYFISLTELHTALIGAMRGPGDYEFVFPKRSGAVEKMRSVPRLAYLLARVRFDRNSHVFIAHPFSSVTSAFAAWAKRLSFFDDGIAYYAESPLPVGTREERDRRRTRNKVDWAAIAKLNAPTYTDLLRNTDLVSFHALFPDQISDLEAQVVAIDHVRAFPRSRPTTDGAPLYLDTRDDSLRGVKPERLFELLHSFATASASGMLYFKSHPTQVGTVSHMLKKASWAAELSDSLESGVTSAEVDTVISVFSSGSITMRLADPALRVVNVASRDNLPNERLRGLFEALGAEEVLF